MSAPCRWAASRGVRGGRARRVPATECAACVLEPWLDAESRSVGAGGTRIAGGGAERREDEGLQIFEPIPHTPAHLDELRASAAIAPALQTFYGDV